MNNCDSALSLTPRLLVPHSLGEEILLRCWLCPLTHGSLKILPTLGSFLCTEEASIKDPCWESYCYAICSAITYPPTSPDLNLHQKPSANGHGAHHLLPHHPWILILIALWVKYFACRNSILYLIYKPMANYCVNIRPLIYLRLKV